MIIYSSEKKIDNLAGEIGVGKPGFFNPFSNSQFSLKYGEFEAKISATPDAVKSKMNAIIRYLDRREKLHVLGKNRHGFKEGEYYICTGRMHLHNARDNHTGLWVDLKGYVSADSILDIDVEIEHRKFTKVVLTGSAKNVKILDFSKTSCRPVDSMGASLLANREGVSVQIFFVLTRIDESARTLYGSPLFVAY